MRIPTFRELLGDEAEFFATVFDRRPALLTGGAVLDPSTLLTTADLDQILVSEAIRPPYLEVAKNGRQVNRATYTEAIVIQGETVVDRIIPERVAAHFRAGATLSWNALNHHRPALRTLVREVSELFAARAEVVAFLTPAGYQGLSPHFDPTDVFVVQLEGTKTWRVWPCPEQRPREEGGPLDDAALGEPLLTVTLKPGDMLYMPYQSPHVAIAEDTTSLHLSVTVEVRRRADVLVAVVDSIVQENPEFWDSILLSAPDDAALALKEAATALAGRLLGVDPAAEVRHLAAGVGIRHGIAAPRLLSTVTAADALDADSRLARAEGADAPVVERSDTGARIRADGAVYAIPDAVADALTRLVERDTVPVREFLRDADKAKAMATAQRLVRIGVLRVMDAGTAPKGDGSPRAGSSPVT